MYIATYIHSILHRQALLFYLCNVNNYLTIGALHIYIANTHIVDANPFGLLCVRLMEMLNLNRIPVPTDLI